MKSIVNKNKSKEVEDKFKLNDESMISDTSVISNTFKEFFVNIGPNRAKKFPIQNVSPLQFMDDPSVNSIFLSLVTAEKIKEIVCSLKMELQTMMKSKPRYQNRFPLTQLNP